MHSCQCWCRFLQTATKQRALRKKPHDWGWHVCQNWLHVLGILSQCICLSISAGFYTDPPMDVSTWPCRAVVQSCLLGHSIIFFSIACFPFSLITIRISIWLRVDIPYQTSSISNLKGAIYIYFHTWNAAVKKKMLRLKIVLGAHSHSCVFKGSPILLK